MYAIVFIDVFQLEESIGRALQPQVEVHAVTCHSAVLSSFNCTVVYSDKDFITSVSMRASTQHKIGKRQSGSVQLDLTKLISLLNDEIEANINKVDEDGELFTTLQERILFDFSAINNPDGSYPPVNVDSVKVIRSVSGASDLTDGPIPVTLPYNKGNSSENFS